MTIHYPNDNSLAELRRVFALLQRPQTSTKTDQVPGQSSGGGIGLATGAGSGAPGPAGADGADGGIDPTLMVMSYTEEEDIIMDNLGNVVSDELGYAVTEAKVSWEVVTDENGIMLTAE